MRFWGRKRRKKVSSNNNGNRISGFALLLRSGSVPSFLLDAQTQKYEINLLWLDRLIDGRLNQAKQLCLRIVACELKCKLLRSLTIYRAIENLSGGCTHGVWIRLIGSEID